MQQKSYGRGLFYLLLFISIIIGGAIMRITAPVMIPVIFSIMLALAILPLIRKLNHQFHMSWNWSVFIVMTLSLILIFMTGTFLVSSLKTVLSCYPLFEQRFMIIYGVVARKFKIPFNETLSLIDNLWSLLSVRTTIKHLVFSFSFYVIDFVKNFILIIFLILFLLAEMHRFRDKINAAFNGKVKGRVIHVFNNIILEVTRFISIKFIVSLMTGIAITLGTFLIGLDFSIVWGFIGFIFNFIPIFGAASSCIVTIAFSVLQFYPDTTPIILTGVLLLGINILMGNVIEPRIIGRNLGLSPFIVLVSLSAWGWLWGFAGMILAVPATVILKIICENISYLHPVAILLGDKIQQTEKELSPVSDESIDGTDTPSVESADNSNK